MLLVRERLDIETLINVKNEFGDFEVGSHGEVENGRENYMWAKTHLYLRFGYWGKVNVEKLQEILGDAYIVKEQIADYDDYGSGKYVYNI